MNIHVFQHVPYEPLNDIEPWIHARGHRLTTTRFFAGEPIPAPDDVDWLIVMGGPMSVHEHRLHPWLQEEKAFLRQMIDRQRRVLGICLGAQLLADVLGARVYQNGEKEIGWYPIRLQPPALPLFGSSASSFEVFHWHGDTFELPVGATWLAESAACRHQAFSLGPHIVGLQFHLEMNPLAISALLAECRGDLAPGRYVQEEWQMMIGSCADATAALHRLLEMLANGE